MVFNNYSQHYDLFYSSKNYIHENEFVNLLVSEINKNIHTILDLGCGTGGHDIPLGEQGYHVTGVDLSANMIQLAKQKLQGTNLPVQFHQGDIRTIRLRSTFDLVISMFAVMGYQTTNEDFLAALQTARNHLEPGGLFIFDTWYGPAVLHELPETRIKEFAVGDERIIRMAIPEHESLYNKVTVNYKILRLMGKQIIEEINETHPMRYLFAPEIYLFAAKTGFEVIKICPFMDASRQPTEKDWNVTWVLKAV